MDKYKALIEHQGLFRNGTFIFSISKIINVKVNSIKHDVDSLYQSFNQKQSMSQRPPGERQEQKSKAKRKEEGQQDLHQFFNTTASTLSLMSN